MYVFIFITIFMLFNEKSKIYKDLSDQQCSKETHETQVLILLLFLFLT